MNTLRLAVVLLFGLILQEVANAWEIEWVDEYGGTRGIASANSAATDPTGVYVAGPVEGALAGQVGAGGTDAYLRKYSFGGTVLWTRQFGTAASDTGLGVATDATGIYVSGRTSGALPGQSSAGGIDPYVRKYNADGDVLWTSQFGTSASDRPFGAVAAHATGIYVAGETTGTFPGEPGGTGVDFFVARLDADSGQVIWVRQFGNRSDILLLIGGVSADDSGVYVAGSTELDQEYSVTSILRKYDFDGNLVWSREFPPGPGVFCGGTLWSVSSYDGNVYVAGQWDERYYAYAFEDPPCNCGNDGAALGTATTVGVLLKYDADGNLQWRRRLKGAAEGFDAFTGAKAVQASAAGIYVGANLTTTFAGYVPEGSSADHSECPGFSQGNNFADKLDAYVRRYDANGNVLWTHQFGSSVYDLVVGIGTDESGVYLAGNTSCSISEDVEFSDGFIDAFVVRMSHDPASLPGQVQLIVGQLETLKDGERLNSGEFGSLVLQLESALRALDRTDGQPARQALEAFVQTVSIYQQSGRLTSTEAAGLIDAAEDVIAQL